MTYKRFLAIAFTISFCSAVGQNLRYIRELQSQLDTTPPADQWQILSELAMEHVQSDSTLAWRYYQAGFRISEITSTRKAFTARLTKAHLYQGAGASDSARYYYQLAIEIAEALGDEQLKGKALENLASLNIRSGNTTAAIRQFKDGINLAQGVGDSSLLFGLHNNLGLAYQTLSNYDSAMVFYLRAARYCNSHPIYNCAALYNNMGIIYQTQGELGKAEPYNFKALEIRAQALDSIGMADSYLNIAGVHWFQGQIDSATYFVNLAYEVYLDRGNVRGQSLCLSNLGAVYNYQGKYEEAIAAHARSIVLHKQSLDRENLAVSYFNMAEPQLALKRYNTTFAYLDTAMETASQVGSKMILRESYDLKSKAYEQMGRIREAWNMKELYHAYKDSITTEATDQQVAELEARFETEEKEHKINEQELQLAQQELKIQQNSWIIASVIGISLFILIMAILQRKQQKLKAGQRLTEERKRLIEQQIEAVVSSLEKERRRFSEDLHDGFGQYISLIRQKVEQLNDLSGRQEKEDIYHESEKLLKEMGGELKNICFNLMPRTLIQQGLDAALTEYLFRINSGGKIATEYISHGLEEGRLEEVLEINLYRVCQEWTNNIMKHGNAHKIAVQIVRHDDQINLTIEDDGDGFDPENFKQSQGNGWKNMLSRISLMKGEVLVDTRPGIQGTTFMVDVPVSVAAQTRIPEITQA